MSPIHLGINLIQNLNNSSIRACFLLSLLIPSKSTKLCFIDYNDMCTTKFICVLIMISCSLSGYLHCAFYNSQIYVYSILNLDQLLLHCTVSCYMINRASRNHEYTTDGNEFNYNSDYISHSSPFVVHISMHSNVLSHPDVYRLDVVFSVSF